MKAPTTITTMDKYEMSACIGFWRCGVDFATIAAILKKDIKFIYGHIKMYEEIKG